MHPPGARSTRAGGESGNWYPRLAHPTTTNRRGMRADCELTPVGGSVMLRQRRASDDRRRVAGGYSYGLVCDTFSQSPIPAGAKPVKTSYRLFVLAALFALGVACWSGFSSS